MRQERVYGGALVLSAVALLATGMFHPTGAQILQSAEAAERVGLKDTIVHAFGLGSVWLALFGMVRLSQLLGFARLEVQAAFIAFAMACGAVMIAAIVDGILVPKLASRYFEVEEPTRGSVLELMRFCGSLASALSRFYITAVSVAVLLWSWAAWRTRFHRVLPWVGVVVALPALVAQLLGYLHMNVWDVLVLALGQGVWMVWAGVVLMRLPEVAKSGEASRG
jgi:hypothetical protein